MAEATTTAEKKRSWWPLLWGLAALLICPYLPLFEALIPIQQTLLLLVPVIAIPPDKSRPPDGAFAASDGRRKEEI